MKKAIFKTQTLITNLFSILKSKKDKWIGNPKSCHESAIESWNF